MCVGGEQAAAATAREGAVNAKPLSHFGPTFGKFVRRAMSGTGAFLAIMNAQALEGAALSAVAAAAATDRASKLQRLGGLVDAAFDREKKGPLFAAVQKADFLVIVCGLEVPHKWNGPTLAIVVTRRSGANKPTLIIASGDPMALYGESATGYAEEDTPTYVQGVL